MSEKAKKKWGKTKEELDKISKATRFKSGRKQVEIARLGGIASGKAKQRLKTMREYLELGAELPFEDTGRNMLAEGCRKLIINFARSGDTKSAETVAKLLGQYVQEIQAKVETSVSADFVNNFLGKFKEGK